MYCVFSLQCNVMIYIPGHANFVFAFKFVMLLIITAKDHTLVHVFLKLNPI